MNDDEIRLQALPLQGEVTIGRGSQCDVQIDHPSISRTHLRLRLDVEASSVIDLESANGTMLRGVRLPPNVAVQISSNEPIRAGDLTLVLQEIRRVGGGARGAVEQRREIGTPAELIVLDPAMRRLYDLAGRVAPGAISVLLTGETGTGKEVLAEFLHRSSPRARAPLVRINCAALTETLADSELFGHDKGAFTGAQRERVGLLEAAHGGTVFLDEIGELTPAIQAKLLRVLEAGELLRVGATSPRPIDVRFVAATNRDLEDDIEAGTFRRDLYFRIAGVVLAIPPLRTRAAEIETLARRFAVGAAGRLGRETPSLTVAALAALQRHDWPGNVRELRNAIERAVLLADAGVVDVAQLALKVASASALPAAPVAATAPSTLSDQLATLERQRILETLERCGGNQTRAAEALGMPRRTLLKRLDHYGVQRPRKS